MAEIQFGLMMRAQFPRSHDMPARFAELVEQARLADRLGYASISSGGQSQAMPAGDNDLGVEFDELRRDRFLLGSPDEVADAILRLHRAPGINHLIMS